MSEKPKNFPPVYNAENAQNPAPQNSNDNGIDPSIETTSEATEGAYQTMSHSGGNVQGVDTQTGTQAKGEGYTKHRFNETPGNGGNGGNGGDGAVTQSWIGGPQNQNETPREAARNPQTGEIQKPTDAAPSRSDSNPETSTQNDGNDGTTWHGRGK